MLALRDAGYAWGGVPRESPDGPRLQRVGSLMAPAGRGYPSVCRAVAPEDLVRVALEEVAGGAQWVKVLGDFPDADGNWFAAPSNYSADVLARLVREVHAAGARVMGHSTGLGAADLVTAGVDSAEHGMALTPDQVAQMADRGIAWTATLATAFKDVGVLAEQSTPVGAYIRGQLDRRRDLFPKAVSLGVPVLAGTDEIPMGASVARLSAGDLRWSRRSLDLRRRPAPRPRRPESSRGGGLRRASGFAAAVCRRAEALVEGIVAPVVAAGSTATDEARRAWPVSQWVRSAPAAARAAAGPAMPSRPPRTRRPSR